jgi:hypothetical protein
VHGYEGPQQNGLSFEIGDPWRFYALFWKAHDLDRLAELIPVPEAAPEAGGTLALNFLACNHTAQPTEIRVVPTIPKGWSTQPQFTNYPMRAGECYPIQVLLTAPPAAQSHWEQLSWIAMAGSQSVGSIVVRVFVGQNGGLPQ